MILINHTIRSGFKSANASIIVPFAGRVALPILHLCDWPQVTSIPWTYITPFHRWLLKSVVATNAARQNLEEGKFVSWSLLKPEVVHGSDPISFACCVESISRHFGACDFGKALITNIILPFQYQLSGTGFCVRGLLCAAF